MSTTGLDRKSSAQLSIEIVITTYNSDERKDMLILREV